MPLCYRFQMIEYNFEGHQSYNYHNKTLKKKVLHVTSSLSLPFQLLIVFRSLYIPSDSTRNTYPIVYGTPKSDGRIKSHDHYKIDAQNCIELNFTNHFGEI